MTKLRTTLAMLALAVSTNLPAAEPPATTNDLLDRLRALYPGTRFGELQPTPWAGVFEVGLGSQLAYVDGTGRYFLFGHLFDMSAQRDLTAERKDSLTRIDFATLPLADAIREVRGNGMRTLAIFSDPDCPYCRRLEAQIRDLDHVTIYTFLLPLASIHPQARAKAISVWCAEDRTRAWRALMDRGIVPAGKECPHPVDRTVALADRLGLNGTPTLIAGDGRILAGAASLEEIEVWLAQAGKDATR